MPIRWSACFLCLLATVLWPCRGVTQTEPSHSLFFRLGAGVGSARELQLAQFGSPRATGFVGDLQAGVGGHRVQGVIDFVWQPFRVPADRGARLWYLVGGLQIFVDRHVYLRPGLGLGQADWVTPCTVYCPPKQYIVAGVSVGGEWRVGPDRWLDAELGWRDASCTPLTECNGLFRLFTLQILVPFYAIRR